MSTDALPGANPWRSDERAWAGMAVAWLTDERMDGRAWMEVFARLADGKPLDVPWLREEVLGFGSERDMEKSWDLWMAGRTLVRQDLGTMSAERWETLADQLHTIGLLKNREAWRGAFDTSFLE